MEIRSIIKYVTAGFVIGTVALTSLQYITNNNIKELISGNEGLLNEYNRSKELVLLQRDLILLDNKIKSTVVSGDSTKIREVAGVASKVKNEIADLQNITYTDSNEFYLKELDKLVDQKISYGNQVIDTLFMEGRPAADRLLQNGYANNLSNQISKLTHKIDTSGRAALTNRLESVDLSGQSVLNWNLYIFIFVLILLTTVFLFLISRLKIQYELINRLNTSEKKLKEAAQIKENFLANMSHEIRTPLNAILGYTNLLQKEGVNENTKMHLATVSQSGEALLSIVNDILDLSKIESGMMRIEATPFNLHDLLHSVITLFQYKVQEKGLQFKTDISTDIPEMILGDSTRLTQILVNIISNSLKFTTKGEVILKVQKRAHQPIHANQLNFEFIISDTGVGIEPEKQDSIFDRFSQAEDSTTRKFGGTGLGLSIVKDLVLLQNGTIKLESQPDVGTTVTFSIPYSVTTLKASEKVISTSNTAIDLYKNQKVLIIEDNPINQGLIVHFLKNWGVNTTIANNGREGLEILKNERFELILMDIQMPELDGYAATIQIRNTLKLKTPIVAMTAHAMAGEREKCISFGMNDHISKPIRESVLREILHTYLTSEDSPIEKGIVVTKEPNVFQVINLDYMKEISDGDTDYEKLVTEQFLSLIPEQLQLLKQAQNTSNITELKRIAHSLKTSISVMGLNDLLQDELDDLELKDLSDTEIRKRLEYVTKVCELALSDSKIFYSQLQHPV